MEGEGGREPTACGLTKYDDFDTLQDRPIHIPLFVKPLDKMLRHHLISCICIPEYVVTGQLAIIILLYSMLELLPVLLATA